jgi:hypothetical protein
MNLMGVAGALQGIGEAGSQVATGKLDAQAAKLKALLDSLKQQQGTVDLEETKERLRRLKLSPDSEETKVQQQIDSIEKALGRKLTEDEKKTVLGLPGLQSAPKITNEFEAWREAFKTRTGRYPTDEEIEAHHKTEQKSSAGTKPTKENTYDPSGHLRSAFVDPNTGEVVAWGPLVPEREAFHYITDTEGNVHAVRMPTMRTVTPGEIRQTEKAAKQWEEIAPKEHKPLPTKMVKPIGGTGGGAGTLKSDVIGQTTPKYTPPLANALKAAQGGYTNWLGAMKNSEFHTPKTDLAIVFSAVRAQVEGAGRMTNTELDREMKAGSFGDRFQRWYEGATKGTLPDDQRQDLINVIRDGWLAKAETARAAWQSDMPDKEMPIYIRADNLDDLAVKVKH